MRQVEFIFRIKKKNERGKVKLTTIRIIISFGFVLLWSTSAAAQIGSFFGESSLTERTVGGNISLTASAYTVDGIENRRAPTMLQTSASSSFSLFGFNSGINLDYSTDESGLRQNMNKIGFDMSWKWLQVELGDVNPNFSTYGLNGARVRGGLLRAKPGNFLLEITGGRSRRAVRPSVGSGFRRPSFNQVAYGAKIGYGKESTSYFHISTFYAQDDVNSLKQDNLSITPEENITLTPNFQILLFSGKFKINSEVTVSYFTRDLNSQKIDISDIDIPDFLKNVVQPRETTQINYAGAANAEIALNVFRVAFGYERIQPGFESLGRGTIRNDKETVSASPSVNLLNNRLKISADAKLGRDNLLGNRLQTQEDLNTTTSISFLISEHVNLNANYNFLRNLVENKSIDAGTTIPDQTQISHNISLAPSFTFRKNNFTHNVSLSGGYLYTRSDFGAQTEESIDNSFLSESITSNVNYVFTTPGGISVNTGVNFLTNTSDRNTIENYGFNIGTGATLLQNKVRVNVNGTANKNRSEFELSDTQSRVNELLQLGLNMNATINITSKDNFSLILRARSNRLQNGSGREFTELEGSLNYQRRF